MSVRKALVTIQSLINATLYDSISNFIVVFKDDIHISSQTHEDH